MGPISGYFFKFILICHDGRQIVNSVHWWMTTHEVMPLRQYLLSGSNLPPNSSITNTIDGMHLLSDKIPMTHDGHIGLTVKCWEAKLYGQMCSRWSLRFCGGTVKLFIDNSMEWYSDGEAVTEEALIVVFSQMVWIFSKLLAPNFVRFRSYWGTAWRQCSLG